MKYKLELDSGRVEEFKTEDEARERQTMLRQYGIKSEITPIK